MQDLLENKNAALAPFAETYETIQPPPSDEVIFEKYGGLTYGDLRKAREAREAK